MSYLRARGNRFGPVASRGHVRGDELPRMSEGTKMSLLASRLTGPSSQGVRPARGRPGFSSVSQGQRGVEPTVLEARRRNING